MSSFLFFIFTSCNGWWWLQIWGLWTSDGGSGFFFFFFSWDWSMREIDRLKKKKKRERQRETVKE